MTNFELSPAVAEQDPRELMKERSLRALASWHMAQTPYKDGHIEYPHERLWLTPDELEKTKNFSNNGRLYLPDGPWAINETVVGPTDQEIQSFLDQGLALDTNNRPVHPWLDEMIVSPEIGVVTGRGFYWRWGPNQAADTILIAKETNSILLIDRSGTGQWALPGGMLDKLDDGSFEDPLTAAIREFAEEASVDIGALRDQMQQVYQGIVADSRATANAWVETTAFLAQINHEVACKGDNEIFNAAWFPIEQVPAILKFGSHSVLVELALRQVVQNGNI